MSVRVYQIAKELNIPTKELIAALKGRGVEVRNFLASLSDENVALARSIFSPAKDDVHPWSHPPASNDDPL